MIAYDKTKLKNTFLLEEAETLLNQKFISKMQFQQIKSELPTLNSNRFFLRFGFFILGSFLISSVTSITALIAVPISGVLIKSKPEVFSLFICGIFTLIGSEFLARQNFYKHGLNDAFIISAIMFFSFSTGQIIDSISLACGVAIIIGIWCCIRFVHTFSIIIVFLALIGLIANLVISHKICDKAYLPFIGLILGFLMFFLNRYLSSIGNYTLYKNSFQAVKILSLTLIYLSMNYLVVRQLSEILMKIQVTNGQDIPLASIFYTSTFAIPISYIILGLKRKDYIFFNLGLILLGFSIISIRYYYEILPTEIVLTLGGILLFAITYFSIRKLKDKTYGLTFQPDRGESSDFMNNVQAFASILQTNKHQPTTSENPNPFGGGEFSGGGSGGDF